MSLFASLFPLAQKTTLTLLITVEGDELRVNVTPRPNDDAKGEKTLYPLSLLGTPDELDRDFAEAVSIYEPSTLSVLDQARAASAANGKASDAPKALPAPTAKAKRGRKPAADAATATSTGEDGAQEGEDTPPVDSRQTSIPGIDPDAEPAATEAPAEAVEQDSSTAQPAAEDDGVDLL
ncbi:PRTRC system protein E [Paraburkholderia sp. BCC1885]|uniref:PRTRC system protein E n=1 Tax=Paraburkholderia sp. BCC1885 TaxID=2562669 RepID=UPI00118384EF|nr:PRTRC system protein E [Paraburkholderia sp. BCC1885]